VIERAGSVVRVRAYLDHAATTPMRPQAVAAMSAFPTECFGNPSGSHSVARAARLALDEARDSVARDLGCDPGEVVFTSGGTESDNLAVSGSYAATGGEVVCSAVEHHAVLRACESVGGTTVAVDTSGKLEIDALADALHHGVSLVSVMLANNEVGTIQPIVEVAAVVRDRAPGAALHTDAVAAVGWLDVVAAARPTDLVSVSAHKFGGPKGVGALVVRDGVRIEPRMLGGEQERGRRAGTHDVAGIVGMAAALSAATAERDEQVARTRRLRDRLADGVLAAVEGASESAIHAGARCASDRDCKLASSFHVRFDGVDSEELLYLLDEAGICASAGSACASGALEPSHVLLAMGFTPAEARSAVRFSLGATTTEAEIDHTLDVLPKLVEQLRS
jgi:cysteine desulfurase